jgi:hypothetical protein
MPLEQPRKVYRYQAFSATTASSLCHDKLYFADPGAFNDPHDCKPTVDSDSDNEKLRAVLKTLIKRRVESETLASLRNARVKGERAEAHAHRSGDQDACQELAEITYKATDPEFNCSEEDAENWLLTLEIQRELLAQYDRGVCCFASAVDNPLLWSHYGDQHRGLYWRMITRLRTSWIGMSCFERHHLGVTSGNGDFWEKGELRILAFSYWR